jgi:dihydroorotate dehydrogenase/Pyruvate/2-oxoacid:ferredoxin oxidoreductase delta subunit
MASAVRLGIGGIVSKTVSVVPAADPRPTIRLTAGSGLMNCETWSETPVEDYIDHCRQVSVSGTPFIVSIGYSPEDVATLGPWLQKELQPSAIEFSTHYSGHDPAPLIEVARTLRESVDIPIWMKLSPNVPNLENLVQRVNEFVDAFVAINSFGPVLDFDVESGQPRLGSEHGQGWLSGPPIRPIALHIVNKISSIQKKPVIGVGGVESGMDAIKFIMAGASAVQVCSAAIKSGQGTYSKIAAEMNQWLDSHNYTCLSDIRGMYRSGLNTRVHHTHPAIMSVDPERCTGCKSCLKRCVQGALSLEHGLAAVSGKDCIGCGFCQDYCPFQAMSLISEGSHQN